MKTFPSFFLSLFFCTAASLSLAHGATVMIDAQNPQPFKMEIDGNIAQTGENLGVWPNSVFNPLKDIGITELRIHDTPSLDWDHLFPDFTANTGAPESYHFADADRILKAMVESGFIPFLRLGVSVGAVTGHRTIGLNPPDIVKWTEIANHILAHYVNGWANGFHYDIKKVEIWNEPDLGFWGGDSDKFNRLCGLALKSLKQNFPQIKFGGAGFANVKKNEAFVASLLTYLKNDHIPLDFFSWHVYEQGQGSAMLSAFAQKARALLNQYGFNQTESIITEYNAYLPSPYLKTDAAAVDVASTLMWAQKNEISALFFYPLIANWGLYTASTDKATHTIVLQPSVMVDAYIMNHDVRTNTPMLLQVDDTSVPANTSVLASQSADAKTLQVLIAFKGAAPAVARYTIKNVSAGNVTVTSKNLHALEFQSDANVKVISSAGSEITFEARMSPMSVKLIKMEK